MRAPVVLTAAVMAAALAAAPAEARTITVGAGANGKTVVLHRTDRLRIRLAENPSTGYHWQFAKRPAPAILRFVSSTFVAPPQTEPPTVGAGGTRVYLYRARGMGRTTLRLKYVGPGSNAPVARRYRLTVRVR
jgi:predicted secreted protein